MAIITRTGQIGTLIFQFDYDDQTLKVQTLRATNPDQIPMHWEWYDTDGATILYQRDVNGNAMPDVNIPLPFQPTGFVKTITKSDGSTRDVLMFLYRISLTEQLGKAKVSGN